MALKNYNPTTPGRRNLVLVERESTYERMLRLRFPHADIRICPIDIRENRWIRLRRFTTRIRTEHNHGTALRPQQLPQF